MFVFGHFYRLLAKFYLFGGVIQRYSRVSLFDSEYPIALYGGLAANAGLTVGIPMDLLYKSHSVLSTL